MDIIRDPAWQFVGAIFAFLAISITLLIYFLQRKKKRISYEIISRAPLLSIREEIEGIFKIYYEDKLVKNVQSVIIKFYNNGNQPIKSNDFERNLSISFGEAQILSSEVIKTDPNNLNATINVTDNKIVMDPLLLNPKDSFTLKTLLTDSSSKINLDYRIIGVNKINQGSPGQAKSLALISAGLLVSILGIIWLTINKSDLETKIFFDSPETVIALISISIGYLFLIIGMMSNRRYTRILFSIFRKVSTLR